MIIKRKLIGIIFLLALNSFSHTDCKNLVIEPYSLVFNGNCPNFSYIKYEKKFSKERVINYGDYSVKLFYPDSSVKKKTEKNNIIVMKKNNNEIIATYQSFVLSFIEFNKICIADINKDGIKELIFGGTSMGSVGRAAGLGYIYVISLNNEHTIISEISSDGIFNGYNFRDVDGDGEYEFICLRGNDSIDEFGEYEELYFRYFKLKNGKFIIDKNINEKLKFFKTKKNECDWKCIYKLTKREFNLYSRFTEAKGFWK